jgi:hypothetical protein
VVARLLIWSLFDSKTTFEELRVHLPELEEPDVWLWNDAGERFGAVLHGPDLPDWFEAIRDLFGFDPVVAEEFDVL